MTGRGVSIGENVSMRSDWKHAPSIQVGNRSLETRRAREGPQRSVAMRDIGDLIDLTKERNWTTARRQIQTSILAELGCELYACICPEAKPFLDDRLSRTFTKKLERSGRFKDICHQVAESASSHLKASAVSATDMNLNPVRAVCEGYLIAASPNIEDPFLTRVGLSMLALGAMHYAHQDTCRVCFRNACPGLDYCAWHSQSDSVRNGLTAGQRAHLAEIARHDLWLWTDHQVSVVSPYERMVESIRGMLDPSLSRDAEDWRTTLPIIWPLLHTVQQLLGADFASRSIHTQMQHLRDTFDANEWRVGAWGGKLVLFEMSRQKCTSPLQERASSTEEMLGLMAVAASAGGFSFADIARVLGKSRNHVWELASQWRKANPELALCGLLDSL